ncbi:MAG: hypothetical protein ACLP29_03255 [Dissulfurispiraceae bacterium]
MLTGIGLVLSIVCGTPSGRPALTFGAIVVIAVLCERWRYHRIEHCVSGQWQRTGECFEDPETGQTVEVLYDPISGERRYAPAHSRNTQLKQ